jgi:hypothetical protein
MPITPDPSGYVAPTSNAVGIQGAWYGYGDCWGTNGAPFGDCENKGNHPQSACSAITFPLAATPDDAGEGGAVATFTQMTPGTMCLSGTAAKVIGTPPDYTNMFGIGIGLDFNNQGGVKMPYSATANHVTGFSFHLSGVPAAGIRVEIPSSPADPTGNAWAMTSAGSVTIKADGDYIADLTTMVSDPHHLGPSFTPAAGTTQQPFDATKIASIQFHVATSTTAAVPVTNMCVSNFQAIVGP